ncbi:hypothetical protein DSM112329_02849 [Paraconexibacter sp. AEG42_29]|uniref:Uncharacterized protein n=1 Tax=Paraconexibacter sp. AEG42_29 TaxID=2997339 RepID=A0AAU7AWC2_9ACTN
MRILDELGDELSRAAHDAEGRRGAGQARSLRRTVLFALLGLLTATGVAVAAAAIIKRGDPLPTPRGSDVPPELTPRAGTAVLNGLNVTAPDGGPVWDVRTSRSRTGAVCATVGQVFDGELGIVGLDGTFHALRAGAADACSVAQQDGFTLAGARGFRGRSGTTGITVVSGVAGRGVRTVRVAAAGSSRPLQLGPGRAFLAIFTGQPDAVRPRVTATLAGGGSRTLRFADTGQTLAADPSGGAPWAVEATPARRPDLRCVVGNRTKGPDSPTPSRYLGLSTAQVPVRCGPRGTAFVATQRFVPYVPRVGVPYAFFWGPNVSRTIVWGATGGAQKVTVLGASAKVAVDRATGAFMAVLPGQVDPRRLSVRIGNRTLRGTTAVGRRGQRLATPPVPAWRSVASVLAAQSQPDPFRLIAGTVEEGADAEDVAGGPAWSIRTWKARIDARTNAPRGYGRDLLCFAVGQRGTGNSLREPLDGGRTRAVGAGQPDGRCNGPDWLATHPAVPAVLTYVDDPGALEPKPVRVVVAGLLGDNVRSAELLGAGAPRALALGPHGSFLLVLDPRFAGADLRVRQVRATGAVRTSRSEVSEAACRIGSPPVRVADPDGGPTWIAGIGTTSASIVQSIRRPSQRGPSPKTAPCRYVGRLVGGRLASVADGRAQVYPGPGSAAVGGTGANFLSPGHPVIVEVRSAADQTQRDTGPTTPAQIARRTLPGRTTITGIALKSVTSITLRTPRDVRTLVPDPRSGVFLAVYDGPFYGGEIVATSHQRNGRTVVKRVPLSRR